MPPGPQGSRREEKEQTRWDGLGRPGPRGGLRCSWCWLRLPDAGVNSSGAAPATSRPKSTGTISIIEPKAGQTVTGGTLHVQVAVEGATILNNPNVVKPTPSQGHVHLSID